MTGIVTVYYVIDSYSNVIAIPYQTIKFKSACNSFAHACWGQSTKFPYYIYIYIQLQYDCSFACLIIVQSLQCLGKVGIWKGRDNSGALTVAVGGKDYILSPLCVLPEENNQGEGEGRCRK